LYEEGGTVAFAESYRRPQGVAEGTEAEQGRAEL